MQFVLVVGCLDMMKELFKWIVFFFFPADNLFLFFFIIFAFGLWQVIE